MKNPRFFVLVLCLVCSWGASAAVNFERVWVNFKPGKQAAVQAALANAQGNMHYVFAELNAFAVSLPAPGAAALARNPNVEYVEADPERYPLAQTVPYGIDLVQAPQVWARGYTGTGIKIGIIDSGFFLGHEDLPGLASVTGDSDPGGAGSWFEDGCGHGSHVAGTIAAVQNDWGVVGVSFDSSLHIVRVFGDDCSWAYSSDLVNAAFKCRDAAVRVINMSLGGSIKSRTEEQAFKTLDRQGILSVAAAGNGGNRRVSYPAGYASVVSVAAIDENKAQASFSQFNRDVELAAPGVAVESTIGFVENNSVTVESVSYQGNWIEHALRSAGVTGPLADGGLATAPGAWSGQVVLAARGDISFFEKVQNVQNGGGIAAVIYNNAPGNFSGTLGDGNSSTIPAISVSQEDGQVLLTKLGLDATVVSLRSAGSGYAIFDGTSMSTPHVVAVAALIWSARPDLDNAAIRKALQATAEDLGPAGRDIYFGYGLVRAHEALNYVLSLP